jgi:hypothetical protein
MTKEKGERKNYEKSKHLTGKNRERKKDYFFRDYNYSFMFRKEK